MAAESSQEEVENDGVLHRFSRLQLAVGFFIAALIMRLIALGRADMWTDEILFAGLSRTELSPLGVLASMREQFLAIGHFPFPYMVQNIFLHMAAPSVENYLHHAFLQRLPAAIWGALSVPIFFLLSERVIGRVAGVCAACMMAIWLYPVFYSREAYVYAPLLFASTLTLLLVVRAIQQAKLTKLGGAGLFIAMVAAVQTHISGSLLVGTIFAYSLLTTLIVREQTVRKMHTVLWLLALGALLTTLPFFWQYLAHESPHNFLPAPALPIILKDVLGKIFLGTHVVPVLLSGVLFVTGLWSLWREKIMQTERRFILLVTAVCMMALAVSANRTQYFSRYFLVILPGMYIVMTAGLSFLSRALAPTRRAATLLLCVTAVLAGIHACYCLPLYYSLEAKAVNFGGIADWLNQNLDQGTPYVMESAYELRFVSGYFPTPGLVPAAPHVHGPGPEEMQKLRSLQRAFLTRFPLAPFIESARHGSEKNAQVDIWTWPATYFKRMKVLRNDALRKLVKLGIWPQVLGAKGSEKEFETPIYYNTREDLARLYAERGLPVMFSYDNWACVQIQQGTYARATQGANSVLGVENLTAETVRGNITITGGLAAPEGSYPLIMSFDENRLGTERRFAGQLWSFTTPVLEISPGSHQFRWIVGGSDRAQVQNMILTEARFEPAKQSPD